MSVTLLVGIGVLAFSIRYSDSVADVLLAIAQGSGLSLGLAAGGLLLVFTILLIAVIHWRRVV